MLDMVRWLPILILLSSIVVSGQDAPEFTKTYRVRPLEFEVGIPPGWLADQDHSGMVCRSKKMGFMVSREPFLHDKDQFAGEWERSLGEAGNGAKVTKGKAGKYVVFSANWDTDAAGGRTIHVARVWVPQNEMLYNFSFSAPRGTDMEPLVSGVLKSFKCTAAKPKLSFNATKESLGARISITLPQGYAKQPRGVQLGGGDGGDFVRIIEGYKAPHIAGAISFRGYNARITYELEDGSTSPGSNVKRLTEYAWEIAKSKLGAETRRMRGKSARYGKIKGHAVEAGAYSKKGLPKRFFAWGGKIKGATIVITLLVDEREARLHKDLMKQVCSKLEVKE